MKRLIVLLLVLLSFHSHASSVSRFDYPSRIALKPGLNSYTLFTQIIYYLDSIDRFAYKWSSPDDEMNVHEDGSFSCSYTGTYRVIGIPKSTELERISFTVRYPDFVYESDRIDITSPDGAFHAFKLQQNGISGLDWKVTGGVFKAEMASRENPFGPNAVHLIPKKPGKGTLTYIVNSRKKYTIDVIVHESAFLSSSPIPTISPSPSPDVSLSKKSNTEQLPHPSEYSGTTLRKIYEPYDYQLAKTSPSAYKNTSIYLSGTVLMYSIMDDGWGYALVLYESDSSKTLYITLPPGSLNDSGIDFGDDIEVYGVAYGTTVSGISYPVVLTTMQIVNHGNNGLYQDQIPLPTTVPTPHNYTIAKTTKSANLRENPSSDSTRVCAVKQGEKLKIVQLDYVDGWHQVEYRGKLCYISAKLVDLK